MMSRRDLVCSKSSGSSSNHGWLAQGRMAVFRCGVVEDQPFVWVSTMKEPLCWVWILELVWLWFWAWLYQPPHWYVTRTGHSARVSLTSDIGIWCVAQCFITYLIWNLRQDLQHPPNLRTARANQRKKHYHKSWLQSISLVQIYSREPVPHLHTPRIW